MDRGSLRTGATTCRSVQCIWMDNDRGDGALLTADAPCEQRAVPFDPFSLGGASDDGSPTAVVRSREAARPTLLQSFRAFEANNEATST
jgi:hypothetical protein